MYFFYALKLKFLNEKESVKKKKQIKDTGNTTRVHVSEQNTQPISTA